VSGDSLAPVPVHFGLPSRPGTALHFGNVRVSQVSGEPLAPVPRPPTPVGLAALALTTDSVLPLPASRRRRRLAHRDLGHPR